MKSKFSLLALALAVFVCENISAQAPSIEWQKSLGGSGTDQATAILQTTDGGFIVAGFSNSNNGNVSGNHGGYDYWIVKLNPEGNIDWQKSLGGSGDDQANSVQETIDGGFIVAGYSNSNNGDVTGNHGSNDYWVVKLDSLGNLIWQKSLGGSSNDVAYAILITSDGRFILAGYSSSNDGDVSGNHGDRDSWIVRLDSLGNLVWQKSLGGSNWDDAHSIQQTIDGGFIVSGLSFSNDGDVSLNHGTSDSWILKLDSLGNLEWQKSFGGSSYDVALCILQIPEGGFIVGGSSQSNDGDVSGNHGYNDYWILKLDSVGDLAWQKSLGGSNPDYLYSLQESAEGGYNIAGLSGSYNGDVSGNHGFDDFWILNLDSTGNLGWQKCYGGSQIDYAASIQQTTNGGLIVAGRSSSNDGDVSGNHGSGDYWIVKLICNSQFFYADMDTDGYGNLYDSILACALPIGYASNNLDCDDANSHVHPQTNEIPNGIDDNCNSEIDELYAQAPSIEWQKCLGGVDGDFAYSIQQTTDGGFIVGGYSDSNDGDVSGNHLYYDSTTNDYWIVKLGSAANIEWQKSLGGSDEDKAYSLHQTADGGFVVVGTSRSNDGDVSGNHGQLDYWILKLNSLGNIEWQKSLGGSSNDEPRSVQQTSDNEFIIAGVSFSNNGDVSGNHGAQDCWIVKLDSIGELIWQKSLGGSGQDDAHSIQQTTDGGFIIAGRSESDDGDVTSNHGGWDAWIVKLDQAGSLLWEKSFGGTILEYGLSIQQTNDGGFIFSGESWSSDGDVSLNHGYADAWIVKLDAGGNLEWQKSLGGSYLEEGHCVQQTLDNGFILGGESESPNDGDVLGNHGSYDYWIVKLDASGNFLWQKCLGGSSYDHAKSIKQTTDGGLIVAGVTHSFDNDVTGYHGYYDYWIVKLSCQLQIFYADADSDGYGNINDSIVACPPPPGFVANHSDCNDSNSNVHPGAVEIPSNGIDDDCNGSVDECSSNFILYPDTLIPHHYWALNLASGVPPLSYYWSWGDGTYDSIAYPSHTYAIGGFYTICLTIHDSAGCESNFCSIDSLEKMSAENTIITVNVVDSIPSIPTIIENASVLQSWSVFPNPASKNAYVNYSLLTPAIVSVEVYDVLGNKLQQIINEDEEGGQHHLTIATQKLPNGVYVLQIRAGDQIESQKMVVVN